MEYYLRSLYAIYELAGLPFSASNAVITMSEIRRQGTIDGLEGKLEEFTGIPLA